MFRKLLILGAIAALFTIATVVPASAIAVETGPDGGPRTVLGPGNPDGTFNDAHGPACGNEAFTGPDGCKRHSSPDAAVDATDDVKGMKNPFGTVLGAWNAVFQTDSRFTGRDQHSAICGIWATTDEAEEGFEFLACDFVAP